MRSEWRCQRAGWQRQGLQQVQQREQAWQAAWHSATQPHHVTSSITSLASMHTSPMHQH